MFKATTLARIAVATAIVFSPMQASGQPQRMLPSQVRQAIEQAERDCGGAKIAWKRGFVTRQEINGDGIEDIILNYEHARCGDAASMFCGTGGCLRQVFATVSDGGFIKVLDGNVYEVRFGRAHGRPAMTQLLHGVHCGRSGAEGGCRSVTYWNGSQFTPAHPLD